MIFLGAPPEKRKYRTQHPEMEHRVVELSRHAARDHAAVPPVQFVRWKTSGRKQRVREHAPDGSMDRVHACLFGPLRNLNSFFERVALLLPRVKRVAEIHRVQFRLQVIIGSYLFSDGLNNLKQKRSSILE